LPDYLDTTAKIYGYRVDHVNKEISGLVNNVKTDILKKNTDDMDEHTEQLTQVKTKVNTSETVINLWSLPILVLFIVNQPKFILFYLIIGVKSDADYG